MFFTVIKSKRVKTPLLLINLLLLFSCNNDSDQKKIQANETSLIENFSISGTAGEGSYTLKAAKAKTGGDKNIFELDNISFELNSELVVSAEKGKYFKQDNFVNLEKVKASYGNMALNAAKADFRTGDARLEITNPDIKYFNHQFSGTAATFNQKNGLVSVKQIKARLSM